MKQVTAAVVALLMSFISTGILAETKSAEGARVFFIGLTDGARVSSPVTVTFGLVGMSVAPAGMEKQNSGHHHLLIDRPPFGEGPDGAAELRQPLPFDAQHLHFAGGRTEAQIDLPPGRHSLQLVQGDTDHYPHDPPILSDVIEIIVE
ncbi:MAG: DUF4399 domain-containing protein [Alphaproteobacteria bacterium]|nr:DUF4399 domain-containing protein [Alphaproteobacteria bacterium]MBO6861870.1 DUF4399 domain-containing protein [Alphaproteobacteria bacterium]